MVTPSAAPKRPPTPEHAPPRPPKPEAKPKPDEQKLAARLRPYYTELLGTFALTLVAAGGEVIAQVSGGEVSHAARAVAPGLAVLALIYAIGDASGAHFNPAVTFAFTMRGYSPWTRVPGYWASQMVGALGAAALLRSLFGDIADLGASRPQHGVEVSLVMEVVLTDLLITVILGTATVTAWSGRTPRWRSAARSRCAACLPRRSAERP